LCCCYSLFHLLCWLQPASLQDGFYSWAWLDLDSREVVEAQWYHSRADTPILKEAGKLVHFYGEALISRFPRMTVFTADGFSQVVKSVSVYGLLYVTLFWNNLRWTAPFLSKNTSNFPHEKFAQNFCFQDNKMTSSRRLGIWFVDWKGGTIYHCPY
jgi:hypothetical protein